MGTAGQVPANAIYITDDDDLKSELSNILYRIAFRTVQAGARGRHQETPERPLPRPLRRDDDVLRLAGSGRRRSVNQQAQPVVVGGDCFTIVRVVTKDN